LQYSGNFHAVIAGEFYGLAQPSALEPEEWVSAYGLRSIVNLRCASGGGWYRDEAAVADRLAVHHVDFAMRGNMMLKADRAVELIDLLRNLFRSILIHCSTRTDRTELAAALYLADLGLPEDEAEDQISFRYGDACLPGSAAWSMDLSWEALEPLFHLNS